MLGVRRRGMRPAGKRSCRWRPANRVYASRAGALRGAGDVAGAAGGRGSALLTDNAPLVGLLVRGSSTSSTGANWDVLALDLPPGTGEPLATLLETVRFDGVVLVTTPQDVARLDAGRALAAFQSAKVPVLGVVENMAYLVCPHCGERIEVFHRGRVPRAVADGSVPLLAEIPLDPALSAAADSGRPVLITDPAGPQAVAFLQFASETASRLGLSPATEQSIPMHRFYRDDRVNVQARYEGEADAT